MTVLSDAAIRKLEPPERGQRIIYDDHKDAPPGFGIRALPSGTVAFILRYQAGGTDRRLTIGRYPTWTLAAARKRAVEYKRKIDGGADIVLERKVRREAPTVADAAEQFCREHYDKLASGKAARSRLRRYFLSEVGAAKVKDVKRAEVRRIIRDVAETKGREAGLLLANIKVFFGWCEDEELIDSNPVATLRPAKISPEMKPRSRTRVLDDDEIRAFWESVESVGMHRLTALALKLVLVTGQRPGEVVGMCWSEIKSGVWTIPGSRRGKTDTEHHVPLTKIALAILEDARAEVERLSKRRKTRPGDIVFETRPGQALRPDAVSKAVGKYREALGSKDSPDWGCWTAHDLRRTMRTGLAAAGVPVMVAEIAIGHAKKGIIGVYDAHHYQREIRTALEAWERRLNRIVEGKPADDNVATFTRERLA
ncbi:MAG: tyrosine-type recombinase/integrase [Pseudomonadota bacterium]|nr:MAG: tyrosine-type recombinase/integrase [Pseudomonadota bacterium]